MLKVISSSPGDLEPVFQAMLDNATRICEAKFGALFRFDGEVFHLAAEVGTPPEYAEFHRRRGPFKPIQGAKDRSRCCGQSRWSTSPTTPPKFPRHQQSRSAARDLPLPCQCSRKKN